MGGWRVMAASVRGSGHERNQTVGQDAHRWHLDEANGLLLAALADGAGSAPRGELGASVAANAAIDSLLADGANGLRWLDAEGWRGQLTAALRAATEAVSREAAQLSLRPRDLATTLIVAVASRDFFAAVQIGDGAAVFRNEAGDWQALTTPATGEYANETTFLCSPKALETSQFGWRTGSVSCLAAFTDGLQRLALKLPAATPHAPFFEPFRTFLAKLPPNASAADQLADFLRSPRVRERTDDDCTLLVAVSDS